MAKIITRARRPRSPFGGGTFIQRSRNESSEQKAIFHNVTGAGRSHVIREFFALGDDDKDVAHAMLQAALDRRVAAGR